MHWYWWLLAAVVGLLVGWLAGLPYKSDHKTSKLVINLIIGVAGGLLGTFVFWLMSALLLTQLIGVLLLAAAGSILLLWMLNRVKNDNTKA